MCPRVSLHRERLVSGMPEFTLSLAILGRGETSAVPATPELSEAPASTCSDVHPDSVQDANHPTEMLDILTPSGHVQVRRRQVRKPGPHARKPDAVVGGLLLS